MPYDPFHGDAKEAISVSVTRRGNQLVSRIDFLDASGHAMHRELTSPDTSCGCWSLIADSAFSVAVELTPLPAPAIPKPSIACEEPARRAPGSGEASTPRTRTAPRIENALDQRTYGVGLMPLVSIGLSPSIGAGGAADIALRWNPLSLGLDLRFLAAETTDNDSAVRTFMGRAHVSACGHRGLFSLCGVLGLGRLFALKDPTIKIIETQEPWSGSIGVRPTIEWQFSEVLALRAFAELNAILGQASVWVDGQKLWAAPPVAGILGVGVVLPFGNRGSNDKNTGGRGVPRLL